MEANYYKTLAQRPHCEINVNHCRNNTGTLWTKVIRQAMAELFLLFIMSC